MKKYFISGLITGLVLFCAAWSFADEFTGYPTDLNVWMGRDTLRVRSDGELDVQGTMVLNPNPSSAFTLQTGVVFFDSTDLKLKYYDGSAVKEISVE